MDPYLSLFLLNFLLIFADAAIGSGTVPSLLQRLRSEEGLPDLPVPAILAGAVTLYMFFNCLGFFRKSTFILLVVTLLVVAEMIAQLFLRRRAERQDK